MEFGGHCRTTDLGRAIGLGLRGALDKLREFACAKAAIGGNVSGDVSGAAGPGARIEVGTDGNGLWFDGLIGLGGGGGFSGNVGRTFGDPASNWYIGAEVGLHGSKVIDALRRFGIPTDGVLGELGALGGDIAWKSDTSDVLSGYREILVGNIRRGLVGLWNAQSLNVSPGGGGEASGVIGVGHVGNIANLGWCD